MISSIFNSEVGKLLSRIILPYLAVMGAFCFLFDGWFVNNMVFVVEDEGPAKLHHFLTSTNPKEIPIFGNSRSNNGIDPKAISNDAWNYAINGSGGRLLRFELEAELAKDRKTPIVIGLDSDYLFANFFGDVLDYIPLSGDPMVWQFLKEQERAEPYFRLPTLRFYGGFQQYLHRYLKNRVISSSYIASNGASLSQNRLDPNTPLPVLDGPADLVGMPMYADLKKMEGQILSHPDRCFVLAETPYYRRIFYTSESRAQYFELCKQLRTFPNVVWIPAEENELPSEYFSNFTHLNQDGARWFSSKIKEHIKKSSACQ